MYSSTHQLGTPSHHSIPFHRQLLARLSNLRTSTRHSSSKSKQSLLHRIWKILTLRNIIIVIWIYALYWGERKAFQDSMEECQWDKWENWPANANPHRMALIADPQLVDPHTYPRRGIALTATMFYTDAYMSKSYSLLNSILLPETVIFLGDLFDGGREWNPNQLKEGYGSHAEWKGHLVDPRGQKDWATHGETYWENEFIRFNKIFPAIPGRRVIRSLPGNHDLGIGNGIEESVLNRFKTFFGDTNSVHEFGNHTFVLIDSVSLSNTQNPKIYGPPKKFLNEFTSSIRNPHKVNQPQQLTIQSAEQAPPQAPPPSLEETIPSMPRILLTHVPLYRLPNTPCGPLRESPQNSIAIRAGFQYQNVLLADLSSDILRKVKPVLVASGDDHDYCEVTHASATSAGGGTGMVKEITVKAFSWAMGVRKPGFLLVSLWNPIQPATGWIQELDLADGPTVQTKLCLLPDQLGIFSTYAFLGMLMKFLITLKVVWAWWMKKKTKEDDYDGQSGPLLPISSSEKSQEGEFAVTSSSFNNSGGMNTRNGTLNGGTNLGPHQLHKHHSLQSVAYAGYGLPRKYSNDEDKYNKKYQPLTSSTPSPPSLNGLGLGITNLSHLAEKANLTTLTHHPVVQDGVQIVKREMLKYKGRQGLFGVLKEVGLVVGVVCGWYLLLVSTDFLLS